MERFELREPKFLYVRKEDSPNINYHYKRACVQKPLVIDRLCPLTDSRSIKAPTSVFQNTFCSGPSSQMSFVTCDFSLRDCEIQEIILVSWFLTNYPPGMTTAIESLCSYEPCAVLPGLCGWLKLINWVTWKDFMFWISVFQLPGFLYLWGIVHNFIVYCHQSFEAF